MIAGIFHEGSGLGNQLFRCVTTRVLAGDKGYEWGMFHPENFKGKAFMELDLGINPINRPELVNKANAWPHEIPMATWLEKKVVEKGIDIRGYDPEINFLQDSTIIDGEFQDERYWKHRLGDIRSWLKVEFRPMADDLCVIGFRGGEYAAVPDLYLPKEYWKESIALKRKQNPHMRFEVHTDDVKAAMEVFPEFSCTHQIGLNWRSVRYAKHLIIANSSFFILPSLLNEDVQEVIAPRYWARRNTGVWALPQNYYSDARWKYL